MKFIVVIVVVFALCAQAFQTKRSSMTMALSDYREELGKTAAAIAGPGKYC